MSHSLSVIAEFRFVALVQLCAAVARPDGYTTSGGRGGRFLFSAFRHIVGSCTTLQSPADPVGVFSCHAHFEYVDTSSRKLLLRSSFDSSSPFPFSYCMIRKKWSIFHFLSICFKIHRIPRILFLERRRKQAMKTCLDMQSPSRSTELDSAAASMFS